MAATSARWSVIASHLPHWVCPPTSDDLVDEITFDSITRTHSNYYLNRMEIFPQLLVSRGKQLSIHVLLKPKKLSYIYDQSRLTRPKDSCIRVC